MGDSARPWFEEITVTPLIEQAVAELRSAIPKDALGISVKCESDLYGRADSYSAIVFGTGNKIEIAYTQQAAAWLLLAVVAYHYEHLDARYGLIADNGDELITPELQVAKARFIEDVQHKLNIGIIGSLGLRELSGTVTVYL